ncbi:MAG: tetratricopeptide repeat protein [Acidimicrobiales bacterium]|nr:MAG: tetratricopeptide repeat protein [Acidimicrobiales bacterium]
MADVTDATFAVDVVERSHTVPVVVDLWAEWCGPCKQLGPILDKVIGEAQGLVELAKVDVDANPQVSQAFQVQSIPAVYAMKDGQVVDGFMGAQGEPAVVEFVQKLINMSDAESAADEGGEGETPADPEAGAFISMPDGEQAIGEPAVIEADSAPSPPVDVEAIEAELETLLPNVKLEDEARERFVALLDELGNDHPSTNDWRRRLTTALY